MDEYEVKTVFLVSERSMFLFGGLCRRFDIDIPTIMRQRR